MVSRQQLDAITCMLQNEQIILSDLLYAHLTQSELGEVVIYGKAESQASFPGSFRRGLTS